MYVENSESDHSDRGVRKGTFMRGTKEQKSLSSSSPHPPPPHTQTHTRMLTHAGISLLLEGLRGLLGKGELTSVTWFSGRML